jgi:hypothetical protein
MRKLFRTIQQKGFDSMADKQEVKKMFLNYLSKEYEKLGLDDNKINLHKPKKSTNTQKKLYGNLNTLYNLIAEYQEKSINVEIKELSYMKTYTEKAINEMADYQINITEQLRQRVLKEIKFKFEVNNSKARKSDYYVWITETDADYYPAINSLTTIIEEAKDNMKMGKKLCTYLKYICTYSDKFFKLVEDTADKVEVA